MSSPEMEILEESYQKGFDLGYDKGLTETKKMFEKEMESLEKEIKQNENQIKNLLEDIDLIFGYKQIKKINKQHKQEGN